MSSVPDTLKKILALEKQKGFSNTSVSGGLEKIVELLNSQDSIQQLDSALREYLINQVTGYSNKSIQERKKTILSLVEFLEKGIPIEGSVSTSPNNNHIESLITEPKTNQDPALKADIQKLSGIGEKNKKLFNRLGIINIRDLLRYFPRRYQDYSKLKPINELMYGEEITVIGSIASEFVTRKSRRGNLKITETSISDSTGFLRLTWFNQPFIKRQLKQGDTIVISGKVDSYLGRIVINNPDWEMLEKDQLNTNRIVPIYSLTKGISQRQIRKIVHQNLSFWSNQVIEYLPEIVLQTFNLSLINKALQQIHFPSNEDHLQSARERFAVEEILFLQLGVFLQKKDWLTNTSKKYQVENASLYKIVKSLPYRLTSAQEKAVSQIRKDLSSGTPMNRLLQGDVGSGKTVVSRIAVEIIAMSGDQAAIMAPTSILAEQHYQTFLQMADQDDLLNKQEIALLEGATPAAERKEILADLKRGKIKLIIGTHALIEDPVEFENLGLVVIDEQHRFGVKQRAALREKGNSPHLLVMTATPIPRSLAMTIYGDMDVSIIDEMPVGRLPVKTRILHPNDRSEGYQKIREHVKLGNQAFIVYPRIEDEDDASFQSAINEFERISESVFPDLRVGLVHGRLKPDEKDDIMRMMHEQILDVLISTTVIEVGVDIPNATIMMIEGANRFGLAQLHQLRGRVGRNNMQAHCFLVPENEDDLTNERLNAMETTNDGFVLADLDLRYRGPGEFLGTRQSGFVGFQFASLTNLELIEKCRSIAQMILDEDPSLELKKNQLLKNELLEYWPEIQ